MSELTPPRTTGVGRAGQVVVLGALLISVLLGSCGVSVQDEPVPVRPVPTSSAPATTPPPQGDEEMSVYFVREGRLTAVPRTALDRSPPTVLRLLLAGPDVTEASAGLQTALSPQSLLPRTATASELTIEATRDFTSIAGDNQLLGVAQLVWTVTEDAPARGVRVVVEGKYIELPTDQGLTRFAVRRDDYTSVAPEPPSTPASGSPTAEPTR